MHRRSDAELGDWTAYSNIEPAPISPSELSHYRENALPSELYCQVPTGGVVIFEAAMMCVGRGSIQRCPFSFASARMRCSPTPSSDAEMNEYRPRTSTSSCRSSSAMFSFYCEERGGAR